MAGSQSHMNCHSTILATVDKFQPYKAMFKERLKTFPFELGVIVLLLFFRSFLFCFFNGANVNDGFSTKASGVFLTSAQEVTRKPRTFRAQRRTLEAFSAVVWRRKLLSGKTEVALILLVTFIANGCKRRNGAL